MYIQVVLTASRSMHYHEYELVLHSACKLHETKPELW
jgi:hypothetical protein